MSNITADNKPTQFIDKHELYQLFAGLRGAKMATIETETEVAMRKTNNPYAGFVTKRTRINVTLNFNYTNSVNNQRGKEGNQEDFVPHARKWGNRIDGTTLILHKGIVYVEAKPNGKPQSVEYLFKGQPIDKSELLPWLPVANSNKEHQGVEKEIIVRDYKLDSILAVDMNKIHYVKR